MTPSLSTVLLSVACLSTSIVSVSAGSGQGVPGSNNDIQSFTTSGYPTIATVGGAFIFLYTIYYSAAKTGYGGWRNHALWFLMDLFLWMIGIFLIFGPDTVYNSLTDGWDTSGQIGFSGGYSQFGPRAAIIGFQLTVQAALGIFAIYAANAYASLVFGIFGIFNVLCLMGSNYLFNYNEPIWLLSEAECYQYFRILPGQYNMTRCHGNGYLEFLRVMGTIGIVVEAYLIIVSLMAYATAVPANYGGVPVGGPVANTGYATGVPTTGYATGVPATTGAYGTTGPAVNQPTTYATSTAQPYAQQTTTTTTQNIQ